MQYRMMRMALMLSVTCRILYMRLININGTLVIFNKITRKINYFYYKRQMCESIPLIKDIMDIYQTQK